ncbi:Macrophage migration inhibitory factor family protein [Spironucleus salmonicida]|uniref:L-dopachrome isomerase n=1 Tax=Spironucleus salmonicida TaxID=348837 RepID=V6LVF4_9EUKA|nr:Macrophage migration inhibitory factor family protein [Spironucleus salmonicida]|eukprot:EST48213.1 Macrophage migration inhibitory factor family protein [Spironucleus salmonicida]
MPYIQIESNIQPKDQKAFVDKITNAVSKATDVAVERYMTSFKIAEMSLSGSAAPCAGIILNAISSISPEKNKLTMGVICSVFDAEMGIGKDRIYVVFNEISGQNWGLRGTTKD